MQNFKYLNNQLYCEKVPVQKIAQRLGTPLFIYSRKSLIDHYRELDQAFKSVPHTICYSIKSNSNIAVCRTLAKEGSGFDIVSGGELHRALKSGADAKKIVFASVGKTPVEIETAIKKGILFFSVESFPELEQINLIAKKLDKKARIALRINPDVEPETHKYITTGKKGTKFGLDRNTCRMIYHNSRKYSHIKPVGIQMHIGSQIKKPKPYGDALRKITPLVTELKSIFPEFKYLDIGGGFGITYKDEKPASAERFAETILPYVKNLGLHLILEPGRFISGNAGILATKVLYIKQIPDKNFVIIDSAMNDLLRPSLYEAYHHISPVIKNSSRKITADIVGPVCESGDFLAKGRSIPVPTPGSFLAVFSAGAYGFSMSSNYNSRPRAAEVMVNGNKYSVIRERETFKDLIKGEKFPSWLK